LGHTDGYVRFSLSYLIFSITRNGGGSYGENLNADHFVNEENLDTLKMNSSSHMDNLKLIYVDLDCPDVSNSPSSSDIEQKFFFYF
jgi:hypothetical protein